jgi:hypothetical protein
MDTRQIDALVAEHVFGFRPPHARGMRFMPRRYSTDIESAWRVVEKMGLSVVRSEDGWYALAPEDIEHGTVRGTDYPKISLILAEGERPEPQATAPMAICLAALQAVGVKVEP